MKVLLGSVWRTEDLERLGWVLASWQASGCCLVAGCLQNVSHSPLENNPRPAVNNAGPSTSLKSASLRMTASRGNCKRIETQYGEESMRWKRG